ncbi:hypothetical protein BpHYR1_001258 [Brachionus plicatilis]|uniref:Uncharacterized protein n=1 Tax=Brachionus plicatilis TaxID=10195 RepID=A0A3M7RCK2_BRAPC|nr:hypothetical protein BpHYR1_001258 [Brachionus plicatilis]
MIEFRIKYGFQEKNLLSILKLLAAFSQASLNVEDDIQFTRKNTSIKSALQFLKINKKIESMILLENKRFIVRLKITFNHDIS